MSAITDSQVLGACERGKARHQGMSNVGHTVNVDLGGATEVQFRRPAHPGARWRCVYVMTYGNTSGLVPFTHPSPQLAAALEAVTP